MFALNKTAFGLVLLAVKCDLHFASLGNIGGHAQRVVAGTLMKDAATTPYSFMVLPGSIFSSPVSGLEDQKWKDEFSEVYAGSEFNMQFFPVLGETDWKGDATSYVQMTGEAYHPRNVTTRGAKWTMPNFFYHYSRTFTDSEQRNTITGPKQSSVLFLFIDTHMLRPGFAAPEFTAEQKKYIEQTLSAGSKIYDWIVVVGDQSIYSSGKHGKNKYLVDYLRPLLKKYNVDAYISGGDSDLEIIEDGELVHIISGSAAEAKSGSLLKHDQSVHFASKVGYMRHSISSQTMTTELVDGKTGEVIARYEHKRNAKLGGSLDRASYKSKLPKVVYKQLPPGVGGVPLGDEDTLHHRFFILMYGTVGLIVLGILGALSAVVLNFRISNWLNEKNNAILSYHTEEKDAPERRKTKVHVKKTKVTKVKTVKA